MSAIKEDGVVDVVVDKKVAEVIASASATEIAPVNQSVTDGADDAGLEQELAQMEQDAAVLRREGLITDNEVRENTAMIERSRKTFRDMSAAERGEVISRRRDFGRKMLDQQISGAAVVELELRLKHTRMKPLFEQWWPYLNRMSLNMQRFGRATFKDEEKKLNNLFDKQLTDLEQYVGEQLEVAKAFREKSEQQLKEQKRFVMTPTVSRASLERTVEVYTPFSMRILSLLMRFDETMDHFDFLAWNGIRSTEDIDDEVGRFLRKFHPIGVLGYMTHIKLMLTVRSV